MPEFVEKVPYRTKLRFIIRNDAPLIFCGDAPTFRTIEIQLIPEQIEKLFMRRVGVNCGKEVHEEISQVFLDE